MSCRTCQPYASVHSPIPVTLRNRQIPCNLREKRLRPIHAVKPMQISVNPEGEEISCEILVEESSKVISVALSKPLGLVLQTDPSGSIVIDEILPGGNASLSEVSIQPGDKVKAVTARSLAEKEVRVDVIGNGRSKAGIFGTAVLFSTQDQSFDTLMAAIGSNRCASCDMYLILERPAPVDANTDSKGLL